MRISQESHKRKRWDPIVLSVSEILSVFKLCHI